MGKVTLKQILQYLVFGEDRGLIQVVTKERDWDDAYELTADCELLEPFFDYIVTDMSCELSYMDGNPVIRVGIEKGDQYEEAGNVIRLDDRFADPGDPGRRAG